MALGHELCHTEHEICKGNVHNVSEKSEKNGDRRGGGLGEGGET